jgi:small-conductance mechanosensitive channel
MRGQAVFDFLERQHGSASYSYLFRELQDMTSTAAATGRNLMDDFATSVTLLLKDWIRHLIGPQADQPVLGAITWADVGAALCFVLLAFLANALAAVLVRRHAKPMPAAEDSGNIDRHVFQALGKPLYVLIWAYGLYFAAQPLLLTLKPGHGLEAIGAFFGTVFDLGLFAVLFWAFFRFTHVLDARLALWASRSSSKLDHLLLPLLGKSLRIIVPVMGVIFALPILNLPPAYADVVSRGTSILLIAAVTLILFQAVRIFEHSLLQRFDIKAADNLRARKVYTQVSVIRKVIDVIIGLFAVASVLMLFPEVRHVGTSLLASAGIVGVVAGIAAQKTVSNLLAGFQIALAQPMRQDDVVIVEGEWGRVEEITLTYVVVHIWDDRRMVLPLSYFIEKPFQNWTRASAKLLGSVFLWVDYSFPVEQARKALQLIIEASPLWDKRFWNLQVTDASDRSMQLRILATAADSSAAFDLRCEIREKFIAYIQVHHPQALPQLRAQLGGATVAPLPPS